MSIKAMNWAWAIELPPGEKLVLLALADFANEDGLAWPSAAILAERSGQSVRTVLRQLTHLCAGKLMKRESRTRPDGTRSTNAYYLQFEQTSIEEPEDPCDNLSPGSEAANQPSDKLSPGSNQVTKTLDPGDTAVSQQEPPLEPSVNKTFLVRHEKPKPAKLRKVSFDPEDTRCASWMLGKIREFYPGFRAPNLDAWANEIRLMRERDGRTHRDIAQLFVWANADAFWRTNILSPHKLREQWDQLSIKRGAGPRPGYQHTAATAPPPPRARHRCCHVDAHGHQCEQEGSIAVNGAGSFCREHLTSAYR